MIGLIYEILADKGWNREDGIYIECVPGISSLNSCAALVGSPLMTDFAVVSMSDLLVPWEIIVKRVEAAALGDYVTVIYNPASKKRIHQLGDTRDIFLKYRKPESPVPRHAWNDYNNNYWQLIYLQLQWYDDKPKGI
jgi:precorrin-3B C17-methyltransferase